MVTFQIVPYNEIENLSSVGRIRKLLNLAKDNKIVLLQGRLKNEEENELIKATMEEINREFKGIELAVIGTNEKPKDAMQKLKSDIMSMMLGQRQGITIIGSANVVKKIKKNPNKIELMTREIKKRR
ncbi:DUF2073 domain-containing protein [Candidatus Woesearchaeota archaeon]|nr:DUF2073 domain-containing protein [Candidatus Woesearchaeota archaeon]